MLDLNLLANDPDEFMEQASVGVRPAPRPARRTQTAPTQDIIPGSLNHLANDPEGFIATRMTRRRQPAQDDEYMNDEEVSQWIADRERQREQMARTPGGRLQAAIRSEQSARGTRMFHGRGLTNATVGAIPFVGSGVRTYNLVSVRNAALRIEKDKASDDDYKTVAKFLADSNESADKPLLGKIFDLVTDAPAFAVEFALTSGAFSIGARGATAGINRVVAPAVARQAVGRTIEHTARRGLAYGVGVAAQTAANPHRVLEASARRSVPTLSAGEDGQIRASDPGGLLANLPAGFAETAVQLGSERTGAALPWLGGIMARLPVVGAGVRAVQQRWVGSAAGRTLASWDSGVNRLLNRLGGSSYHGIAGEVFEERVGEIVNGLTGLTKDYGTAGDIIAGRFGKAGEQLLIEAIGFSALPFAYAAASKAFVRQGLTEEGADRKLQEVVDVVESAAQQTPNSYLDESILSGFQKNHAQRRFGLTLIEAENQSRSAYGPDVLDSSQTQQSLSDFVRQPQLAPPNPISASQDAPGSTRTPPSGPVPAQETAQIQPQAGAQAPTEQSSTLPAPDAQAGLSGVPGPAAVPEVMLSAALATQEASVPKILVEQVIQKAGLSKKEAIVARGRYLTEPPIPLEEIGKKLGMTRAGVERVEKRVREKLEAVADNPLPSAAKLSKTSGPETNEQLASRSGVEQTKPATNEREFDRLLAEYEVKKRGGASQKILAKLEKEIAEMGSGVLFAPPGGRTPTDAELSAVASSWSDMGGELDASRAPAERIREVSAAYLGEPPTPEHYNRIVKQLNEEGYSLPFIEGVEGVLFAPSNKGSATGQPGMAINDYEFRKFGLTLFEEAGYIGKVPQKQAAAYMTFLKQIYQSSQDIINSLNFIHEIGHGISFKHKLGLSSGTLNPSIKRGLQGFDYDPARRGAATPSPVSVQEGFAELLRLQVTNQLGTMQLTSDQQTAVAWAEAAMKRVGVDTKVARLTEAFAGLAGRSIEERARGIGSPTGQPAQPVGMTAREGMTSAAAEVGAGLQRTLENRLAPTDDLTQARKDAGMADLVEGQDLGTVMEQTAHLPQYWASKMAQVGVIGLERDANGNLHEKIISQPSAWITEGVDPKLLQSKGNSFADRVKKFFKIPVHEELSFAGTFILSKNIANKEARGVRQAQAQGLTAQAERNITAASPEQQKYAKDFLDDLKLKDPALFQQMNEMYARYVTFTDALLEARVMAGRMTKEQAAAWRADEPDYVSLARVMENEGYTLAVGKHRHGSGRQFVDPFLTLEDRVELHAREMALGLKDQALIKSGDHGAGHPLGVANMFREIIEPNKQDVQTINLERRLTDLGFNPAQIQVIVSQVGSTFELKTPWRDGKRNIYTALDENGQKRVLEFNNKPLYDLVAGNTGVNSDNMLISAVAKIVGLPGPKQVVDLLKFGATTANLVFPIRNMMRDPFSYTQNVVGRGAGFMEALMNFAKGHGAAFTEKGRVLLGKQSEDAFFKIYDDSGGEALRGPYAFGPLGKGQAAWRIVRGEGGGAMDKTLRIINKTKDALEFIGAGEHGPRFAEFEAALLERGYAKAQVQASLNADPSTDPVAVHDKFFAMSRAALATVKFARQGELTHELNKAIPFLTPAIAGLSQETRNWGAAFKEMRAGHFGPRAKAMVGVLGVYIGAELLHHFMVKDEEWYTELPAHLRYNWWILGQRANGGVWGIPKPPGLLRMFGSYVQEALRARSDKNPRFGMATEDVLLRQATPRMMPIGVGEAVDVASNRSWSGAPIVPARSQREQPRFDQFVDYQLPYLLDQLSGGLLSRRVMRPPWEAFTSSQGPPTQSVTDYYSLLQQLEGERTRTRRAGVTFAREREYRALHSVETRMQDLARAARGEMRFGNQTRAGQAPSQEELRRIREEQITLARRALELAR